MKVTDAMIDRACEASFVAINNEKYVRAQMRIALEAALAEVPEPRQSRQIARELLEAKERIAYLEAKLAERSRT